jgi:hypothetical protein
LKNITTLQEIIDYGSLMINFSFYNETQLIKLTEKAKEVSQSAGSLLYLETCLVLTTIWIRSRSLQPNLQVVMKKLWEFDSTPGFQEYSENLIPDISSQITSMGASILDVVKEGSKSSNENRIPWKLTSIFSILKPLVSILKHSSVALQMQLSVNEAPQRLILIKNLQLVLNKGLQVIIEIFVKVKLSFLGINSPGKVRFKKLMLSHYMLNLQEIIESGVNIAKLMTSSEKEKIVWNFSFPIYIMIICELLHNDSLLIPSLKESIIKLFLEQRTKEDGTIELIGSKPLKHIFYVSRLSLDPIVEVLKKASADQPQQHFPSSHLRLANTLISISSSTVLDSIPNYTAYVYIKWIQILFQNDHGFYHNEAVSTLAHKLFSIMFKSTNLMQFISQIPTEGLTPIVNKVLENFQFSSYGNPLFSHVMISLVNRHMGPDLLRYCFLVASLS